VDFDGEVRQRWDGVDSAGTQEEESGLMLPAVLEEVDSTAEVMIKEVFGAGLAIHSCQDAGIGRAIEHPINNRKIDKVMLIADIPYLDIDSEGTQWLEISFTSFSNQTIDTDDTNTWHVFKKPTGNH
jgi:hypothetical protein